MSKPLLRKVCELTIAALLLLFAFQNIYALCTLAPAMANGDADFKIFRTAAAIISSGNRHMLFDYGTQSDVQQQLYPNFAVGNNPLPYNHPAFEGLLFLPMAPLSNSAAYMLWLTCNVLLLIAALWLLAAELESLRLRSPLPVALIAIAFYPVAAALLHGQDSILSLFLYALVFFFLRRGNESAAGATLAFGLFKPQLVLPFVLLAFVAERRWRALRSFVLLGAAVVALSIAITGSVGAVRFLQLTRSLQEYRPWLFNPRLMANLRGLIEAHFHRQFALVVILSVALLGVALYLQRHIPDANLRFAFQVTATVLLSYHLYPYDLALMLIPLLLVTNGIAAGTIRAQWLLAAMLAIMFATPLHAWLVSHQQYDWIALCSLGLLAGLGMQQRLRTVG